MQPRAVTRVRETEVSAPWKTWVMGAGSAERKQHATGVHILYVIYIIIIYNFEKWKLHSKKIP